MPPVPLLPANAPFTPEQRAWLNGFFAGLAVALEEPADSAPAPTSAIPLLIAYGSQTGTAEALAQKFARLARERGCNPRVLGLERHTEIQWKDETHLLVVTSTYGDGDMPDNAQPFWDALTSATPPPVAHLKFSVLALGDTNYTQFCEAGKKIDQRLEELGATRLHTRADCDVDYEAASQAWIEKVLGFLVQTAPPASAHPPADASLNGASHAPAAADQNGFYDRNRPLAARLTAARRLNGDGSAKETCHVEISLAGSGLAYECGDALGIVPANCPAFVDEILAAAGLKGDEPATAADATLPLREALIRFFDLKPFLVELPSPGTSPEILTSKLRKLAPRLYSIASSPKEHPEAIHLTVGVVRYEVNGRTRKGVCSTFLADRVGPDGPLPVFVHRSPHFRLPADPAAPVIMVGPGTGIAPFRGFLQDRRASGATGKNWLFFGDQRAATDFLYREEMETFQSQGVLHRLDTAFSRDQAEKIYVQHRMLEAGAELWKWLDSGASFYVCGDASRMAKDVETALLTVIAQHGGQSDDQAKEYLQQLKSQKRYLRDVY